MMQVMSVELRGMSSILITPVKILAIKKTTKALDKNDLSRTGLLCGVCSSNNPSPTQK